MAPPLAFLCYAGGVLLITAALHVLHSIHAERVRAVIYGELVPIAKHLANHAVDKWFPDDAHEFGVSKPPPPDPPVQ